VSSSVIYINKLATNKHTHMKTKIPLSALAILLLCSTSIPALASTSGMFSVPFDGDDFEIEASVLNIGGPNVGPIQVVVSVVNQLGVATIMVPRTVTVMPGQASIVGNSEEPSKYERYRVIVTVLGDQKLRLFIKPTVEVRQNNTGHTFTYIPSTEFIN
jgi:hypothetical protein